MNASESRYQTPDIAHPDRPIRIGRCCSRWSSRTALRGGVQRWYERDHFYAAAWSGSGSSRVAATSRRGPARRSATRRVADRARRERRVVPRRVLGARRAPRRWNEWGVEQVNWLHANERMFLERDHIHTALYEYAGELNAAGSTMPSELASTGPTPGSSPSSARRSRRRRRGDGLDARRGCPSDVLLVGTRCRCAATGRPTCPTSRPATVLAPALLARDPLTVWTSGTAAGRRDGAPEWARSSSRRRSSPRCPARHLHDQLW